MVWKQGDPDRRQPETETSITEKGFVIRFELLGLIFAIVVQTIAAVAWGSALTTKVDFTQKAIADLYIAIKDSGTNRYTSKDADRDFSAVEKRLDNHEQRILIIEQHKGA